MFLFLFPIGVSFQRKFNAYKRLRLVKQWWPMLLIQVLRRQRQVVLCELEVSLIYRDIQGYTMKPCPAPPKNIFFKYRPVDKSSLVYPSSDQNLVFSILFLFKDIIRSFHVSIYSPFSMLKIKSSILI